MKIEILKEAIDLSETLNFTRAAANRYITQPALSRHIASLEEELGILLFNREKHEVKLTSEGAMVIAQMRKIVDEYDKLLSTVEMVKEGYTTQLTVNYNVSAGRPFIANASALFERRFPHVHVDYEPLPPKKTRKALEEGDVDLTFTASTFIEVEPPLACEEIYEDLYCLAVGRDRELAQRESVRLEDLEGMEIAMPEESFAPLEHQIFQKVFSRISYKPSKRTHRGVEDISVIVSSGAVVPVLSHVRFYGDQSIVLVPFEGSPFPRASIVAVYNKDKREGAIDGFIQCAHEGYRLTMQDRS